MRKMKYYKIVIVMCLLTACSIGLCTNSMGVFYNPVSSSLNVLKGDFALSTTLCAFSTAFISLNITRWMQRYNYKKMLIIGFILSTLSTYFMAHATTLKMFYLLGIIRGIGLGTYSTVPVVYILHKWFETKQGFVTSIALSFSGLAGAIFSPLLNYWIEIYGWQMTYKLMALCMVILILPVIFISWQEDPKKCGLSAYGQIVEKERANNEESNFNLFTFSFISMGIFTLMHTSITGISQYLSSYSISIGMLSSMGARMMSLVMIGNIAFKFMIGILSDKIGIVKACRIMININMVSLLGMLFGSRIQSSLLLYLCAFLFGSIYAVGAVGIPLLTKHFFGAEHYSKTYSVIGFLTNIGSSLSLILIGYLYDFTKTYQYMFMIAIGIHLVNQIFLIYLNKKVKKELTE